MDPGVGIESHLTSMLQAFHGSRQIYQAVRLLPQEQTKWKTMTWSEMLLMRCPEASTPSCLATREEAE